MSPRPETPAAPLRKVSVCILSWNGRRHLETCLPALRDQDPPGVDWEVLVLDNGSKDGTAAWLRRAHPWVRLVESPVNTGFCAGNNRLAREARGDALAFLNNDTRPAAGWLGALVRALAEAPADVAAVSGRIVDWEGESLDFGRGVMTFDGHAFQLDFGRPLAEARIPGDGAELPFPCGGNMLVRAASFREAGGFDEEYFAYLEDVDLGWRLWAGGERVLFVAGAEVRHRSGASSDLLGLYNRGFLFERNAYLTAYKNYEAGLWERVMPAVLLTLQHRTQTLLVQNNPGAATLTLDPYAGLIADTARGAGPEREPGFAAVAAAPQGPTGLVEKWRAYGPAEFLRRGLAKVGATIRAAAGAGAGRNEAPRIVDGRTVAQLRALTWILGNLDRAARRRAEVQARRRRSDGEIFRRFPAWVVPTYPGDETLFGSSAFRSWLPDDLPVEHAVLHEVIAWPAAGEEDP
ncbi:MAG: glycosyltransferase family 2 protein [Thermoanaerobaculia bacterium]